MDEATKGSYLINWRNSLWTTVREKEKNTWDFLKFYTSGITIVIALIGIIQSNSLLDSTSIELLSVIILLSIFCISTWGIILAIDGNYWLNHNLFIIAGIESKYASFIYSESYLPKSYETPKFVYRLPYISMIKFWSVLILSILLLFILYKDNYYENNFGGWTAVYFGSSILIWWAIQEDKNRVKKYLDFKNGFENKPQSVTPLEKKSDKKLTTVKVSGVVTGVVAATVEGEVTVTETIEKKETIVEAVVQTQSTQAKNPKEESINFNEEILRIFKNSEVFYFSSSVIILLSIGLICVNFLSQRFLNSNLYYIILSVPFILLFINPILSKKYNWYYGLIIKINWGLIILSYILIIRKHLL